MTDFWDLKKFEVFPFATLGSLLPANLSPNCSTKSRTNDITLKKSRLYLEAQSRNPRFMHLPRFRRAHKGARMVTEVRIA